MVLEGFISPESSNLPLSRPWSRNSELIAICRIHWYFPRTISLTSKVGTVCLLYLASAFSLPFYWSHALSLCSRMILHMTSQPQRCCNFSNICWPPLWHFESTLQLQKHLLIYNIVFYSSSSLATNTNMNCLPLNIFCEVDME